MDKYVINFSEVENFMEIHEVLKHDLGLPDYYGGNTDALWDCLTDILGDSSHIEIVGSENVEKRYKVEWEGIVKILKKAKHACNDEYSSTFVVTLVYEDGTHEEIE